MSTCGDCQHWRHQRTDFTEVTAIAIYNKETWDADVAASHAADMLYGHCDAVEMGPAGVSAATQRDDLPLAVVLDGSEYKADLFTRSEFSCILHTPRTTDAPTTESDPS